MPGTISPCFLHLGWVPPCQLVNEWARPQIAVFLKHSWSHHFFFFQFRASKKQTPKWTWRTRGTLAKMCGFSTAKFRLYWKIVEREKSSLWAMSSEPVQLHYVEEKVAESENIYNFLGNSSSYDQIIGTLMAKSGRLATARSGIERQVNGWIFVREHRVWSFFLSHIKAHQKVSTTKEALKNNVDKMTQPVDIRQPLQSATLELIYKWSSHRDRNGDQAWANLSGFPLTKAYPASVDSEYPTQPAIS